MGTSTELAAAIIELDGNLRPITLDRSDLLRSMYQAIGCDLVDVVRLAEDLDMWLDDDGMIHGVPNTAATQVARAFGRTHQPYFGAVLFTGAADQDGDTSPLSAEMHDRLRGILTG